ncbi:MAG: dependent oxidoreductase [Frankiales bacterium]|nr:dependent oxidoreductase [Frankiales bacterium]
MPDNVPVWEDADRPSYPVLVGEVSTEVCVIGLGGSGLTALQELRDRGLSAVGVDAGVIAGGAAGRNGGFLLAGLAPAYHRVVAQLGRDEAARLYRLTLTELDRIAGQAPDAVRRKGSLRIEDDAEGLADCARQRDALHADGFAALDYDGPEGRGLLLPDDGVMQPVHRALSLAEGRTVYERSPVTTIDNGLVETAHGVVHAGAVLVTVDGGLDALLPELRGRVRTVRLQMLATAPTDEVSLSRPVYVRDGYDYWQQLPNGRIAMGGCRDVGGDQEETSDAQPTSLVQQAIERLLRDRLGVRAEVTHRWAARVGYTDSGLPYVGEVRPGVWAAGGYCGTGNVIGAICGRSLVQAALGEQPDWPYFG